MNHVRWLILRLSAVLVDRPLIPIEKFLSYSAIQVTPLKNNVTNQLNSRIGGLEHDAPS